MGYTTKENMVRVDLFKPSGKWYCSVELEWLDYFTSDLRGHLKEQLELQHGKYEGMYAVCLHPHSEFEHPIMLVDI